MTTVHFVYPHAPRISCPDAIGRKVGERLREKYGYRVIFYDWDEQRSIRPGGDDVLLGHPHPAGWTIFRRSARLAGWKRVLTLCPYAHGDCRQIAFADGAIRRSDLYLAITGRYWFERVAQSPFQHWQPKMVHLDLAIDRSDFPVLKRRFNPPGQRRFVYIGHSGWYKNPNYLSEIARRLPETTIDWMGAGRRPIAGLNALGSMDFSAGATRGQLAAYDFLLTVGHSDPNPTTILEAMAWGLIPICTPQSGYVGYPGIANVPAGDAAGAVRILREFQQAPEELLAEMQAANWAELDRHFTWDRFTRQVVEAIETDRSPQVEPTSLGRRAQIRWAAVTSPLSMLRPRNFLRLAARPLVRAVRARQARQEE